MRSFVHKINISFRTGGKLNILKEFGRAGAHSLSQGAITVLQGGDFWQGAASGALGSFGGTIAGGLGVQSLWGTVVITTVSGGVGAYIGGARSAEEILFGMATGAIVGALNHYLHQDPDPDERESTQRIRNYVASSKTVQVVENSLYNSDGVANVGLKVFKNLGSKFADKLLKGLKVIKIYVDNIAPLVDNSLKAEGSSLRNIPNQNYNKPPKYKTGGYMDNQGVWHDHW